MNPDMVTRLPAIADGSLSPKQRVTRVTDPPAAAPQDELLPPGGRKQGAVTHVTRSDIVAAHDSSCTERVTVWAGPQLFDPGLTDEIEGRAAVAQHEGNFPAEFALAFAHLQVSCPEGLDQEHWQTAVNAMGHVLDQCRERAGVI